MSTYNKHSLSINFFYIIQSIFHYIKILNISKFRNPVQQSDIDLELFFFTLNEELILMGDTISANSEDGVILLSHPELIKALPSCTHIACDATFKGIY